MANVVDWSTLPEELLRLIAQRLISFDLLTFRSVSKSWRYSVPDPRDNNNSLLSRPLIALNRLVLSIDTTGRGKKKTCGLDRSSFLSRASFCRVTLSSSSSQGWLIKYDPDHNYGTLHLINPPSRFPVRHKGNLNLLEFNFSEILTACTLEHKGRQKSVYGFKRLVVGGNQRILGVGCDGKIRYWSGEIWTRIKDQVGEFCDVIVANGVTYVVDSSGNIWWISTSLNMFKYGPSLDENITALGWKERSLVECCGEFYIVDRLLKLRSKKVGPSPPYSELIHDDFGSSVWNPSKEDYSISTTIGFKVYKVDKALEKFVEVKSLGCNAFVMSREACFSVSVNEYYGCMQNAIYFSDQKQEEIKMFTLDDGSITTMEFTNTCFRMFLPFADVSRY